MNREAWTIFVGLAVAVAVALLGTAVWKRTEELQRSAARLQEVALVADQRAAQLAAAEDLLARTKERAEALAREMAAVTNTQHRLENEMRAALESRDVAISELQGRLTVNILDRILFDSGEATLKPEGMKVLDQVAGVLAGFTNRQIQVFGHTDNIPIHQKFPSNWELSTARALAAVRYLSEKAAVEPRRLSAVGCGEFQPIADNATPEGRARNRRIALVVLPEQFVPTDVTPAAVATNAPATTPAPAPVPAPVTATNAPAAEAPPAP